MRLKLGTRLKLAFLAVSIAPAILVGVLGYRTAAREVEVGLLGRLETLAAERVGRIERMIDERRDNLASGAALPVMPVVLAEFTRTFRTAGLDSPGYRLANERYRSLLTRLFTTGPIHDVVLIDPVGNVVFSALHESDLGTNLFTGLYRGTELARVFGIASETGETAVSRLHFDEPSNQAAVFLAARVTGVDGPLGVVVIQLAPEEVAEAASDFAGLGETGEIVLVSDMGQGPVFVAPTRHDAYAAFARSVIPGSEVAVPAQESAGGRSGSGAYLDYRNVPVLAAWNYAPALHLGVVVKIDESEGMAQIDRLGIWFLLLGAGTIVTALILSVVITRSVTRPIHVLTDATGRMAAGDTAVRAAVETADEIGELATAFNTMAAAIGEAHERSEENSWLRIGLTRLDSVMRGDRDLPALASRIISEVASYVDAQVAALYVTGNGEGSVLSLAGSYACTIRENVPARVQPGEGLVGQAALEKQQILVRNVPDDYVKVASALGEASPRCICVTPFLHQEVLLGVLEVGLLDELTDGQLAYLAEAMPGIAVSVQRSKARSLLSKSLAESQAMSEELLAQQEGLEAQQGKLKTANEKLQQQAGLLQQSEASLRTQQTVMETTNAELEEKNLLLDSQKTEVEQAREEIARKASDLALASTYKSEFLANMSHELRTPLNSMLLLARGLSENQEGNLSEKQREAMRIIHSSGNDLLALINEILDLSKIEAGMVDLRIADVAVAEFAAATRDGFGHVAAEKNLALTVITEPDAPERIATDRKRVEQILRNLVSNAIKFTEAGSVTVTFGRPGIDAGLSNSDLPRDGTLVIAVRDTGIGIAVDKRALIFEAFRQADGGTARTYGGTGLGLSITRELVQLLGGEVRLESAPGEGSTFTVYLPLQHRRPERTSQPVMPEGAVRVAPADRRAVPRPDGWDVADDRETIGTGDRVILIIEDDTRFARILVEQCRGKGLKCLAAGTRENGIDLARRHLPVGVILDLKLPDGDGRCVLQVLKDDPATRHIPVHIMSAEEPCSEGLRLGAIGHLRKPVAQPDIDAALAKIEDAASRRVKSVLVVEGNDELRLAIAGLIADDRVEVSEASGADEALEKIRTRRYDCMILDLELSDMSGDQVLRQLRDGDVEVPPVIVYTARGLTREEETRLRSYSDSIVIKDVRSDERLLDEVSLFLHRVVAEMPAGKRQVITDLHASDAVFRDKKVLVVDDDMRTVYALSRLLSDHGMTVLKAENGEKALARLADQPLVDLVLMDIMMPVLDGLETIRNVRAQDRFQDLPIIVLTSKATRGDREQCLAAGANDYLPKPVDENRLLSMMRVWLHR